MSWRRAVVTCGHLGSIPVAPGTFGTLGGLLIAWALRPLPFYPVWIAIAAAVTYRLGQSLSDWAEADAGQKDPGSFVIDEVAGYLLVVLWPEPPTLLGLWVAFCAFRFFDIVKPPPIKRLEHVGGGHGIMLDDVMAGFYAWLIVLLPLRLWTDLPLTLG